MSDRGTATFELPSVQPGTLRCASCANRACEALGRVPGVAKVDCDVSGAAVRVEFDPARVSEAALAREMEGLGLEFADSVRHAAWRITGLD